MSVFFQVKQIAIVLLLVIAVNAVVFSGCQLIILKRFLSLEQQVAEKNLLRVAHAVRDAADKLGVTCGDWAVWDDTYAFIEDGNPEYIRSNLVVGTWSDLSLDSILYINDQRELVFGKRLDAQADRLIPVSDEVLDYLLLHERLWPPRKALTFDGVVRFSDGPILLAIRPILTSEGDGPTRGFIVMTRRFDQDVVADLAGRTAMRLSLPSTESAWPDFESDVHLQVTNRSERQLLGEVFIKDFDGNPGIALSVTMGRDLFKQGQETIWLFQMAFLVVSLIAAAILYALSVVCKCRREAADRQFRQAFEQATDGLVVIDDRRRLVRMNMAAQQILVPPECDPARAEQRIWSLPVLVPMIEAGLGGAAAGPKEFSMDTPPLELRAYVAPLKIAGKGRDAAIVTLQDMTQVKALERLKDEFIAAVAHEMNTPLSIVSGYADLLANREFESEEEFREFIELIREKAQALEKIVDDLLHLHQPDAAQVISLEREAYDPRDNVRQLVESFRMKSQRHSFLVRLPEHSLRIDADRHRVGQVLDNLLSNAVKYSPAGGDIRVTLEHQGDDLMFCVADQGIGMTAAQMERAFEKFYRADKSETAVRGMGIGLNIAREIIEAHGGRIWLESQAGVGTRACFALPCVPANLLKRVV